MGRQLVTCGICVVAGFHAAQALNADRGHHIMMAAGLAALAGFRLWSAQRRARMEG